MKSYFTAVEDETQRILEYYIFLEPLRVGLGRTYERSWPILLKDLSSYVNPKAHIIGGPSEFSEKRSLLILEVDAPARQFRNRVATKLQGCSYALYSNDGSSAADHILMIPTSRDLTTSEYEIVARTVASEIDIEGVHPRSYNQCSAFPLSVKSSGRFLKGSTGALLDPDRVLAQSSDSQTPFAKREMTALRQRVRAKTKSVNKRPLAIQTTSADMSLDVPERPWLVPGLLLRGYTTALISQGGIGKTSLLMTMGVSLAADWDLLGLGMTASTNVVMVNNEETEDELRRRLLAICQHSGIEPAALKGKLHFISGYGDQIQLEHKTPDGYASTRRAEELMEFCRDNDIGAVMFDPFGSLHQRAESDNTGLNEIVARLRHFAAETDAAIILAHHARKESWGDVQAGNVDSSRGGKALTDGSRVVKTLTGMDKKTARRWGMDRNRAASHIYLMDAKSNYGQLSLTGQWFSFRSVTIQNGDEVGVLESVDLTSYQARDRQIDVDDVCQLLCQVLPDEGDYPASQIRDRYMALRDCGKTKAKSDLSLVPGKDKRLTVIHDHESFEIWSTRSGTHSTAPLTIHLRRQQ